MARDPWEGTPCHSCKRPTLRNCNGGVREYEDGSSIACENWNIRLDEIGGMTTQEAEAESRYRAQFR
jgi:hypothetical protein